MKTKLSDILECLSTLRDYLTEAHQNEIDNDHNGDGDPDGHCSYCNAIAQADGILCLNSDPDDLSIADGLAELLEEVDAGNAETPHESRWEHLHALLGTRIAEETLHQQQDDLKREVEEGRKSLFIERITLTPAELKDNKQHAHILDYLHDESKVARVHICKVTSWFFAEYTDGEFFAAVGGDSLLSPYEDEVIAFMRREYFI